jgi:hypothetical protein
MRGDQFFDIDLLAQQLGRAGVDAGQFEEVHHHLIEPANLSDDNVEGLLAAFGEIGALGVEHFDSSRQGGDR